MRRIAISAITLLLLVKGVYAQSGVKDSVIRFPFFSVAYGLYQPGGDLDDNFGINSMLSGTFLFKTSKNLVFGVSGGFLFGDNVKDENILKDISTETGQIIGLDGLYADIRIFERGYHFSATIGKVFPFKKPNPNSGILIMGGPGFIQHKIRFEDIGLNAPHLANDYLKGYDQLTNGFELQEFIGYVYFSNRQLINFYGGFEFIQGFTQNRRSYNFSSSVETNKKRIDLLYGFKVGWVLPLYKKKPAPFYLY